MEKINFVNNSTPALNATNLNKLQDNVEDSMKSEKTSSDTDTYNCNYINNSNTYSTNEVLTGKAWIDGKPIYRKVINTGSLYFNSNQKNVSHGISNIDNIVYVNAIIKLPFVENYHFFYIGTDINIYWSQWYLLSIIPNESYITLRFKDTTSLPESSNAETYVILEYTKTTD